MILQADTLLRLMLSFLGDILDEREAANDEEENTADGNSEAENGNDQGGRAQGNPGAADAADVLSQVTDGS